MFAYLGLALFSFPLRFEPALIVWSIVFILVGRALNIFPLAMLSNKWRTHKITKVRGLRSEVELGVLLLFLRRLARSQTHVTDYAAAEIFSSFVCPI